MAKYSKEQVRDMADKALCAKAMNSPRYGQLVATMQVFTGLPRWIVEEKIRGLAYD